MDNLRGSLTIECTMVMPVILSAIMLVITLAVYMYDDTVVSCTTINSAMAGLYIINDSNKEIVKAAEDEALLLLEDKLISEKSVGIDVTANAIYVESKIDMSLNMPDVIPFIGDELKDAFEIHHEYKVLQISPAQVLRDAEKINLYKDLIEEYFPKETENE